MTDNEYYWILYGYLFQGWYEKIEYRVNIGGSVEKRSDQVWQPPMLTQLRESVAEPTARPVSETHSANKSESQVPGNFEMIALIDEIERVNYFENTDSDMGNLKDVTQGLVTRARILLGYEKPLMAMSEPCGDCGGTLVVAEDAQSDVRCTGCGTRYRRDEWVAMLGRVTGLVDTLTAVLWTGRPAGTIRRWASEGRIGRYGSAGRGVPRWSLAELPQGIPGQPPPPPPPMPH